MTEPVITGSLQHAVNQSHGSLAQHFLHNVTTIVLVDTSGSMGQPDSRGGRTRIDVAREELATLQAEFPGKLAVYAFSDTCQFCPGGVPTFFMGGTDLARALETVDRYDHIGLRFVVISDGQPDNEQAALTVAKDIESQIDCVYVGPESDTSAQQFLKRLARSHGGNYATAAKGAMLADTVRTMLLTA